MVKKSVTIFVLVFIFLITTATIVASQETEDEIKKAYDWLTTKVKTKTLWNSLDIPEHAFTLLALQCNETYVNSGNSTLYQKALVKLPSIGTCWGEKTATSEGDCRIAETALAKLAADKLNLFDTEPASRWLLNQSIFFKELSWFLELDIERNLNATCMIIYQGGNTTVNINKNKTLTLPVSTSCFSVYNNYWLNINENCYEKGFKIKCIVSDETKPFRITLHYKKSKDLGEPWYTSSGSQLVESGKWSEGIVLQSYCLVNPGLTICDYEGTALAAYALKENAEEYNKFLPYLIIMEENNEKHLPEALLKIIGVDRFGLELEQLQNPPGFWKAENTAKGQFYDTALAGLTKLGNLSNAEGGARYYLANDCSKVNTFKETSDKKYKYWQCAEPGCEDVRDTAFLLWVFWPEYCPGIGTGSCEEQGYLCKDSCIGDDIPIPALDNTCFFGQVCCKLAGVFNCEDKGGVCKTWCEEDEFEFESAICDSIWDACCKKYSDITSCDEFGGEACSEGYACQGDEVTISGGIKCCVGLCIPEGEQEYCHDIFGINCLENEVCINPDTRGLVPFVNTSYDPRCCPSEGKCILESCSAEGGQECDPDKKCSASLLEAKDVKECCIGTCIDKECTDFNGEICMNGETCEKGYEITKGGAGCCTQGYCIKKQSLWWLWLLIIIVIAAGVLLYFYKFKKPPKKKKPPFGMQSTMMPPKRPLTTFGMGKPAQPKQGFFSLKKPLGFAQKKPMQKPPMKQMRQMPPRPFGPMRPITKRKTEAELEKTLKKLKGMAKK